MNKKKKRYIGTIKPSDIKVRKKSAPPTHAHKTMKTYDRKAVKHEGGRDIHDIADIDSDNE